MDGDQDRRNEAALPLSANDIEAQAERLSRAWHRGGTPRSNPTGGQARQSGIDCRLRGVAVEVKRKPRRRSEPDPA